MLMKAILLAAGKGTRISRMVKAIPKSTLPIDGVPLIRMTVDMLKKEGFGISVCVGYKQNEIKKALEGLDVNYYCNPFYDVTNSIASLWFAQKELDTKEDILILNADVFFSKQILDKVLEAEEDVVMMVDKTRTKIGDYFFSTNDNGSIKAYGKDLPLQVRQCEYVGIAKIKKGFVPDFIKRLNVLINKQKHNMWWEDIIYSFTDNNEKEIFSKDVDGLFWSEIDYFDDYERILNYISKNPEGIEGDRR